MWNKKIKIKVFIFIYLIFNLLLKLCAYMYLQWSIMSSYNQSSDFYQLILFLKKTMLFTERLCYFKWLHNALPLTSYSICTFFQGSSSLNQSSYAWSLELLQLLVYKAAEIDGQEFIRMIFSTSAGKVVFNSYRNSATLPEDVARTNGHLTLANYLQDVNRR